MVQAEYRRRHAEEYCRYLCPFPWQDKFLRSQARFRVIIKGNRSGGTCIAMHDLVLFLMGTHPYRKKPDRPVMVRVVSDKPQNEIEKEVTPPQLALVRGMTHTPPLGKGFIERWDPTSYRYHFKNGSCLQMMSIMQDVERFSGVDLDALVQDEPPKEDIHRENLMRLAGVGGWMSLAFTPQPREGLTYVWREYISRQSAGVEVFHATTDENTSLNQQELKEYFDNIPAWELEARRWGKFTIPGGLIFPMFKPHVYPEGHLVRIFGNEAKEKLLKKYPVVVGIDPGLDHPCAATWCCVNPGGLVFFKTYQACNRSAKDNAQAILAQGRDFNIPYVVMDVQAKERSLVDLRTVVGEFREVFNKAHIPILLGNKDFWNSVQVVSKLLNPGEGIQPQLFFEVEGAKELCREIMEYAWETKRNAPDCDNKVGRPVRGAHDLVDCARYTIMTNPQRKVMGFKEMGEADYEPEESWENTREFADSIGVSL